MKYYTFLSQRNFERYNAGETLYGFFEFFPENFHFEEVYCRDEYFKDSDKHLYEKYAMDMGIHDALEFVVENLGELIVEFEPIGSELTLSRTSFCEEGHDTLCIGKTAILSELSLFTMHATRYAWNEYEEPKKWFNTNTEAALISKNATYASRHLATKYFKKTA